MVIFIGNKKIVHLHPQKNVILPFTIESHIQIPKSPFGQRLGLFLISIV